MDAIRALILSPLLGGPPYLAFFTLLMGCSIGFPFSSDITLITGGVLAGTGHFELKLTILLALSAILLGDTLAFFIGRKFGHRIIGHRHFTRFCPPARFQEISVFLQQNASKFIFMVRFTPGMRSIIFLSAGALKVPPRTFFRMNALSTTLYVPTLICLSFLAANRADLLIEQFQAFNRVLLCGLVLVAVAVIYRWNHSKKRARAAIKH
ncbi:MAG: DedA family protein [Methylotenera sp.]|nr:DedA family protein [Oligoflexia bacterium]